MSEKASIDRPLSGIRVIGLEQYMAGPYCTMLLADAGAEVIKIERPGRGTPDVPCHRSRKKTALKKLLVFMGYNRNKKSVALNLQAPAGQDVFRDLAATADIIIENLRPGAMKKIGLDYQALGYVHPRLIWAQISGFGQLEGYRGPYSDRPAFDIVAEAMSGIMHQVGFADKPPSWTIYGMADVYTGMVTAYGVMQALYMRTQTGRGQFVDSAMFDNMLSLNEAMVPLYSIAGQSPSRGAPKNLFPRGAFECKDGYIALNVPDNIIWKRLCEAMGRHDLVDDERSKGGTERATNAAFLQPIIGDLARLTRDQAVDTLNTIGSPSGRLIRPKTFLPILTFGHAVYSWTSKTQLWARTLARSPVFLSEAPDLPKEAPPALGQHTKHVLRDLGYDDEKIQELVAGDVVGLA